MIEKQKQIINRLKRIEGQLRGVQGMIDASSDCIDVVTQLSAIRSSVDSAIGLIVAENLKDCLNNPLADPEQQSERINKAIRMIIKK